MIFIFYEGTDNTSVIYCSCLNVCFAGTFFLIFFSVYNLSVLQPDSLPAPFHSSHEGNAHYCTIELLGVFSGHFY